MSDRIKIDPENLEQMSAVMESATDAIEEAVALMTQIVAHRDWTCKERYRINEQIEEIQKAVRLIMTMGSGFAGAVRRVLKKFKEREDRFRQLFETVEDMFRRLLSIGPAGGVTSTGTGVVIGEGLRDAVDSTFYDRVCPTHTGSNVDDIGGWSKIVSNLPPLSTGFPTSNLSSVVEPISTTDFGSLEL